MRLYAQRLILVHRPHSIGQDTGPENNFSTVRIPAGGKLMRTFRMTDRGNAYLQNKLLVRASTVDGSAVSIRLTAEQYSASDS